MAKQFDTKTEPTEIDVEPIEEFGPPDLDETRGMSFFNEEDRAPAQSLDEFIIPAAAPPPPSPQEKQQQVDRNTDALSKFFQRNELIRKQGGPAAVPAVGVHLAGAIVEDIYNTGGDIINFMGGGDIVSKVEAVRGSLPNEGAYLLAHDVAKLVVPVIGWMGGLSKAGLLTSKARGISAAAIGGIAAEFMFNRLDEAMMSKSLLKTLPFGDEYKQFIDSPFGDENAAKRLENAIYGPLDGVMAGGVFKALKAYRAGREANKLLKQAEEFKELEQRVTTQADANAPRTVLQEQPIDIEGVVRSPQVDELPDVIRSNPAGEVVDAGSYNYQRVQAGGGEPNKLLMVDSEGNRVFLNLTKFNTTDDVRRTMSEIVAADPDFFANPKLGFDELTALASDLNISVEELTAWTMDQGLQLGQVLAGRMLRENATESMVYVAQQYNVGNMPKADFDLALQNAKNIIRASKDQATMASALQRESAVPVKRGQGRASKSVEELLESNSSVSRDLTPEESRQLARGLIKAHEEGIDTSKLMSNMTAHRFMDTLTKIRYGTLLSNPATHARNLTVSFSNLGLRPAETFVAASINAMTERGVSRAQGVQFREALLEFTGLFQGITEATQIATKKIFRNHDTSFLGVRAGTEKISEEMLNRSSLGGFAGDLLNNFLDLSSRAMKFEDEFTKHVSARMSLNREGYRRARQELGANADSAAISARAEQLKLDTPADLMEVVFREAEEATFTGRVELPAFKQLQELTNPDGSLLNKALHQVAPFARANLNGLTYRLERTPGIARFVRPEQFGSQVTAVKQKALAKEYTLASILTVVGGTLHMTGAIQGMLPRTRGRGNIAEASGAQEYSINGVSIIPESPAGGILGAIATIAEISDIVDGQDQEFIYDTSAVIIKAMIETYNPEYLTDGVTSILDIVGSDPEDINSKSLEIFKNIAGQYIPPFGGLARGINRAYNPEALHKRDMQSGGHGLSSLYEHLKNIALNSYAPGGLPKRRDVIGKPIDHPVGFGAGIVSPFGSRTETNNPVIKELCRLSMCTQLAIPREKLPDILGSEMSAPVVATFPPPSRVFKPSMTQEGSGVRLNGNDYEKLSLYSAGIHPDIPKEMSLEGMFKHMMNSEAYKQAPFAMQVTIAEQLHRNYLQLGKTLFEAEDVGVSALKDFAREYKKTLGARFRKPQSSGTIKGF